MNLKSLLPLPKPPAHLLARVSVYVGALLASVGVGLIYVPAGVVTAGLALVAIGLLLVDVGR